MKEDKVYLNHIINCILKIETYTIKGKEDFMESELIQDAVFRRTTYLERLLFLKSFNTYYVVKNPRALILKNERIHIKEAPESVSSPGLL